MGAQRVLAKEGGALDTIRDSFAGPAGEHTLIDAALWDICDIARNPDARDILLQNSRREPKLLSSWKQPRLL